jgi:DNA polymerase IV
MHLGAAPGRLGVDVFPQPPRSLMSDDRVILHVDMDAFYASVELIRRPELRGRPVVVGGSGARGVVAAASYEARSYGIHSAMPSMRARALCPEAVFLDGDHRHYAEVSSRLMEIFRSFTPRVEPLSLDEAFLDISGSLRLLGEPARVAAELRGRVFSAEGLVCTVGVAPNKFLAKLATEQAKPRPSRQGPVPGTGVQVIEPGAELAFLHPLAVGELWGVGPVTLAKLHRLGVRTVGDLAALPLVALTSTVGASAAAHLHALSRGQDDRPVVSDRDPKSVSHEETFPADLRTLDQLRPEVVRLCDAVASRLRRHGLHARTVQLKLRYGDFSTVTRSRTLSAPSDRGTVLVDTAWELLGRLPVQRGVRLVGVGASNLVAGSAEQQLLFADEEPSWDAANTAIDAIRERFGEGVIGPARLAGRGMEDGSERWGPRGAPGVGEDG